MSGYPTNQELPVKPGKWMCRFGMRFEVIKSARLKDQAAFLEDGKFIFFVSMFSGNPDTYRLPLTPQMGLDEIRRLKRVEEENRKLKQWWLV
jgi:hypothetical protein